ncbi:MAG: M20/M25/M40 family metallo-hydrolase [Armatimonadetes bacterium]|nr:M20/M25/M40 family metallo-hydrolase [Armatimonadota bacterium]
MAKSRYLLLAVLLILVTGCTSCGGGGSASPPVTAPEFNRDRAFADLEQQCAFGARVPGSQAHEDCLAWLQQQFPGADQVMAQAFTSPTPFGGPYDFHNVLALYGRAASGEPLLLCAHWDCRPKADRDPDPARRDEPVMGANDGASGVAVLLEIARALNASAPPRPVVIALLDAEDSGKEAVTGYTYDGFCLGSEYLANHWPAGLPRPVEGILLDLVGGDNLPNPRCPPRFGGNNYLDFPFEGESMQAHPALVRTIWDIAQRRGHTAFRRELGPTMVDDHVPFIEAGIPTIDIIDFPPPEWHTADDTPEHCSPDSLFEVGDTLLQYIYRGK